MKKRITAIVLMMSMLFSCISCASPKKYDKDDCYEGIDISGKPVTITYLTIGDKPTNGMTEKVIGELNKILLKKANAKLDIYYVAWDDYLNNYNSALSLDGDEIDLVGTGSDWLDAWPNVLRGNFLALSENMLKQYCPRTYANVSEKDWDYCSYDGKIYLIPENEYTQWTNHGFIYREDIAREAGLSEIKCWGDLDTYFKYIRTTRPRMVPWDSDGKNIIHALGYIMSVKQYVPIYELGTYGMWGAYSIDPGKIVSPYYEGEAFIKFAKLMKEWDKIGVWREDLNYAGKNEDEFYAGETAVIQHHTQNFYTIIKPNMEIVKPDARTKFFYFGQENGNLVKTSILHGAIGVSAKSKNPERALMVYDLIRNDKDCYMLFNYGIEGVSWELDENGLRKTPDSYDPDTQNINGMTNYWWGRNDDLEVKDATRNWEAIDKLYAEYDKLKIDYPYGQFVPEVDSIQSKIDNCNEVYTNYMKQISYGIYNGSAEDIVAQMQADLKTAGIDDVTAELQKQFDELYK